MNKDLVLYVLMRNDLDSLNPGKAMAQSNHAYGALKHHARSHLPMQEAYIAWQQQTSQDFGTTIVLEGSEPEIEDTLNWIWSYGGGKMLAGWVTDPTYPIRDGSVTHLISLRTCAYVFGEKEACHDAVGHLVLHR